MVPTTSRSGCSGLSGVPFGPIAQLAEANRQAAVEHHIELVGEIPRGLAGEVRVEVKRGDVGFACASRIHETEHGAARRVAPERVCFRGRLRSCLRRCLSSRLSSRGRAPGLRLHNPGVQRQRYQDGGKRVQPTMRDAPTSGRLVLRGGLEQHVPTLAVAARSA